MRTYWKLALVRMMDEEEKYRVEEPQEPEEKTGFLRPLPEAPKKKTASGEAITTFLGITMREKLRDYLVLLLVPACAALIDTYIFSQIVIDAYEASALFVFVIPMLAAVPVGLTAGRTSQAMIGAILTTIFFIAFFALFLMSPAWVAPEIEAGGFFIGAITVAASYVYFIILAHILGALVGIVAREFL